MNRMVLILPALSEIEIFNEEIRGFVLLSAWVSEVIKARVPRNLMVPIQPIELSD